ncbi:MAG: hypothetical protein COB38_10600, partial [Gammaproteobacteria bacterium]
LRVGPNSLNSCDRIIAYYSIWRDTRLGYNPTKMVKYKKEARSLSENRSRSEGSQFLVLFFAYLRRIVTLFDENKQKVGQKQAFRSRLSILGQAPRPL